MSEKLPGTPIFTEPTNLMQFKMSPIEIKTSS